MANDFQFYFQQGLKFYNNDKYDKAIKSLQFAIDINPESFQAQYLLGKCLMNIKRPKDAQHYLKKALELNPNDIDTYYDLAIAYCHLKDYENSIKLLKKSQSLDKSSLKTIRALGIVHLKNSSFSEAKYWIKKYLERNPEDMATMNLLVDSLIENNLIEDSLSILKEFIGFDNNYHLAEYDKGKDEIIDKFGRILLGQKRYREAKDIFEYLFFQFPKCDEICRIYSWACADLIIQLIVENNLEEAKRDFYSFLSLSNRYLPQEGDPNDLIFIYDETQPGYPHLCEYFYGGLSAIDENYPLVLKFFYFIATENSAVDLTKVFLTILDIALFDIYHDSMGDDRPCAPNYYSFGLNPISPQKRIEFADVILRLKKPELKELVLTELKKASESIETTWEDHYTIARYSLIYELDLNFSLRELNTALQLNDTNPNIFYTLSGVQLQKDNLEEFSDNLLIAINKDPKKFEDIIIKKLINILVKKESDPTQLRLIIKNIKSQLDPKKFIFKSYPRIESYFYFILGFFYEREGDLSNAMANYILAFKSEYRLICVSPFLGHLLYKNNSSHEAILVLIEGRDSSEKNSSTYKKCTECLAEIAKSEYKWNEAYEYFKELSKIYPNDDKYYNESLNAWHEKQKNSPEIIPIGEKDINKINTEIDRWERNVRQLIVKKIPDFWEKQNNSELTLKISQRMDEYIQRHPSIKKNELKPIDFFDVRDYYKLIRQFDELKIHFGSQEILKLNFDCMAELRNIIKHNRSFDFSDYYHGKAALFWFNEIIKKC